MSVVAGENKRIRVAIVGAGVAAGAKNATHDDISKPATVSPMVAMPGMAA